MNTLRIFLFVCLTAGLALGATAKNEYARIDLKEFSARPAEFQGRRVTLNAEVVSVDADYQSLDVFDQASRTLIIVSLAGLPAKQRRALVTDPVTRVAVYGRIEMRKGRALLKAEKIEVIALPALAQVKWEH